MMTLLRNTSLPFVAAILLSSCASYNLQKADQAYDLMQYPRAERFYGKVLRHHEMRPARLRLADACRRHSDLVSAEKHYALADAAHHITGDTALNYGEVLMGNGKPEVAAELFLRVLHETPENGRALDLYASTQSYGSFFADSGRFIVNRLNIPGISTAFSAVPYRKGLLIAGEKKVASLTANPWNGMSFLDLYYSEKKTVVTWTEAQPLSGLVNGAFHEGPAVLSPDGRHLYFTRSNYVKRKLRKDEGNTSHLMLFRATQDSTGRWTDLRAFAYNSEYWSTGHAALSLDGKMLYFASDRPGGLGGTDIWRCRDNGTGWSEPENLGSTVNTAGNELFPVINGASLYFSSTAHENMGGLDIFETHEQEGRWSDPMNMNAPINTPHDDFSMVLDSTTEGGYLSSNRDSLDQVYVFWANKPIFYVEGAVFDDPSMFLPNVSVTLTDLTHGDDVSSITGPDGTFGFPLKPNTDYTLRAEHKDHLATTVDLSTKGLVRSDTLHQDLHLKSAQVGESFVLNNIYYDYDKWDIRPDAAEELERVVRLINDNAHLSFELSAHTDARGGELYNLVLSDARANSAVDFLIRHGADPDRVRARGFGEEKLVNHCDDGVPCDEERHQQNRRTEFMVIGDKDLTNAR